MPLSTVLVDSPKLIRAMVSLLFSLNPLLVSIVISLKIHRLLNSIFANTGAFLNCHFSF